MEPRVGVGAKGAKSPPPLQEGSCAGGTCIEMSDVAGRSDLIGEECCRTDREKSDDGVEECGRSLRSGGSQSQLNQRARVGVSLYEKHECTNPCISSV